METKDVLDAFRMRFPADIKGNLILGFPCDALDENIYKIIIEAAEKPYTILEEIIANVCGDEISFYFTYIVGKTNEDIEKINNLQV
jgi:hypothetical protein